MLIVTVNGRILKYIMAAIFIAVLGYGIYRIASPNLQASANIPENIEIFDIGKGCVTKIAPVDDAAIAEAKKILKGITGLYLKANAIPEKGYIIKIPFEPDINVKNHWLNDYDINYIDKMYIIYPEEGVPYLLILDKKERPVLYKTKSSTENILKKLHKK